LDLNEEQGNDFNTYTTNAQRKRHTCCHIWNG
jgi:hypothetical protein